MTVTMSQSKEKAEQEYAKKMDECEANLEFMSFKVELLKLYLEKVRYVYALAFFQWRKSTLESESKK
jgi:hypothetical protein